MLQVTEIPVNHRKTFRAPGQRGDTIFATGIDGTQGAPGNSSKKPGIVGVRDYSQFFWDNETGALMGRRYTDINDAEVLKVSFEERKETVTVQARALVLSHSHASWRLA